MRASCNNRSSKRSAIALTCVVDEPSAMMNVPVYAPAMCCISTMVIERPLRSRIASMIKSLRLLFSVINCLNGIFGTKLRKIPHFRTHFAKFYLKETLFLDNLFIRSALFATDRYAKPTAKEATLSTTRPEQSLHL